MGAEPEFVVCLKDNFGTVVVSVPLINDGSSIATGELCVVDVEAEGSAARDFVCFREGIVNVNLIPGSA